MNELHEKFKARWPEMFTDVPCGFYLPPGWEALLWEACEGIESYVKDTDFKVDLVKEKFGGLRFCVSGTFPEFVDAIISRAESESMETCQECGEPGEVTGKRWLVTLCDICDRGE